MSKWHWWRTPRKREMPADGAKILVKLDPDRFGETKLIQATVRYDGNKTWRVYDTDNSFYPHVLPFALDLELDNEGVTWARGWDTPAADALRAAEALR
jgi:hypothetical protein